MEIISHRVNSLESLDKLSPYLGAEIDVRYHKSSLVLTHDPFNHHLQNLATLDEFLSKWKASGPLILNTKSEGLEQECINLINKYHIKNWFFLDLSMPYFVKYTTLAREEKIPGFTKENLAVRFSDKEPIEYALSFKNQARWVWVDWFETIALTNENFIKLQEAQFKICLVSPELQGKDLRLIQFYRKHLESELIKVDAVCTKRPNLWT